MKTKQMFLPDHSSRLAIALCVLGAFACVALADVKVGDQFPPLSTFKLEGKLPDATKAKVVFVDFWASWCNPCVESFPALNELNKKYADRGLVIIGVNLDESKADMDHFLKENPATFGVVRDASEQVVKKLHLRTFPSSFVLDSEGKVRFLHAGFHGDKTKQEYIQEIESLLGK
jgi:thiol-disulfide isomerase/thioredoxin